ncbi:MAG TPA: urease accessory protein UreF [Gammaproteobacteria bacterium]|nr:urease accessory protein UreF [Gammaproteobacteria bacterium]
MSESSLPSLRLLQLISPTLPTGAFTYSQGMEWAVECGWLKNESDTRRWLQSVLTDSLQYLELPLLARLYAAAESHHQASFQHWSQWLYASRETRELRQEEQQRARALFSVLKKLPDNERWPELETWKTALLASQLAGYALAASHWRIGVKDLLTGYSWSWLENAVAVAIKLVPLGQTEAQGLLYELSADIEGLVERARQLEDDELGASTAALAIASSLHENQYSRLFRS